jgi:hypothetical protein
LFQPSLHRRRDVSSSDAGAAPALGKTAGSGGSGQLAALRKSGRSASILLTAKAMDAASEMQLFLIGLTLLVAMFGLGMR